MTSIAMIADFTTSYGRQALWGVGRYCREVNHWLVNPISILGWGSFDALSEFDGVVIQANTPEIAQRVAACGRPAVNTADNFPDPPLPTVRSDHEEIGRLACEHFLDRGFRNLVFVGEKGQWYAEQRGASFLRRARGARARVLELWLPPDMFAAKQELQDQLGSLPRPVGLFACNDRWGWWAGLECRAFGWRVPEDVAIVGVDNDVIMCQLCHPPLSSVATPSVRIGYEAAALLARLMAGEKPPNGPVVVAPNGVVTRQSSDVLAVDDEVVADALRYIRDHGSEPINVGSVVDYLAVSRRRLEQRFRSVLGRTPADEIRRVRIERACKLLATTDVSLSAIAMECGFSDAPRLTKVFRRETGTTPSEFRHRAQVPDQPI